MHISKRYVTIAAIHATGVKARLIDIEESYYTIDPNQLTSSLTTATKAIIAVHIYGQACDMGQLQKFCGRT